MASRLPCTIRHPRRLARIRHLPVGPLKQYYESMASPANDERSPWYGARYLVLDIETTGFDPRTDHLLSAGWVCVDGDRIDAASARHSLVMLNDGAEVGQSATIHGITDTDSTRGRPAAEVLSCLFEDLCGRVLVCHYAQLELGFMDAICQRTWGIGFWPRQLIDTMQYHVDRRRRASTPVAGDDVRLYTLLEHYQMPATRLHDGLSDAYATALILLAMAHADAGNSPQLRDLLDRRSW